jgi:hypothetical protein
MRICDGASVLGGVSSTKSELPIGDIVRIGGLKRDTDDNLRDDSLGVKVLEDSRDHCIRFIRQGTRCQGFGPNPKDTVNAGEAGRRRNNTNRLLGYGEPISKRDGVGILGPYR